MLTDVNVKNKCACVDVERFKDTFANSKRLLAVAITACRQGFYSQLSTCLLFLSFLFCYADSSKTKILISKCPWPDSPSPFGRAFFYWYLVKSKIRKSSGEQDCSHISVIISLKQQNSYTPYNI